jgi:hypothetical protein
MLMIECNGEMHVIRVLLPRPFCVASSEMIEA